MNNIRISDVTMKQAAEGFSLSFKEKIELAKLLDRLGTSVIELEGIGESRADALRVKSVAVSVKESVVAVPVELNQESVEKTWNALSQAKYPRLQVCAPVSSAFKTSYNSVIPMEVLISFPTASRNLALYSFTMSASTVPSFARSAIRFFSFL